MPQLQQFVGNTRLAVGRLLDRRQRPRPLQPLTAPLRFCRIGLHRLNSSCKSKLATFVVQLLETIEAVARVTHHLARLADVAELFGQLQQADLERE